MVAFIECESVNITYNEMGLATVSYTLIADNDDFSLPTSVSIGGHTFVGHVMSAYQQPILNTDKADSGPWYTTNITMIALL